MKSLINLDQYKATPPAVWTGYVLKCRDGAWFVGVTGQIDTALAQHVQGKHAFTRHRPPEAVVELYEGRQRRHVLLWQRKAIAALRKRTRGKAIIGGARGAAVMMKRPWRYQRTPKIAERVIKAPLPIVP